MELQAWGRSCSTQSSLLFRNVAEVPFPILPHPRRSILRPDPEAEDVTADVVLLPHVGKVEVSNGIIPLKTDEKFAVAKGMSRGMPSPTNGPAPKWCGHPYLSMILSINAPFVNGVK
jgi:hypothetical protein